MRTLGLDVEDLDNAALVEVVMIPRILSENPKSRNNWHKPENAILASE